MAAPAVSVILPTYNRGATLSRAIRSVLAQTFADLELIVVDDASTDATPSIVAEHTDPRLRYVRLEGRQGAARARNAGIEAARADWLAFQDSDDEWACGKLAAQLDATTSGSHPMVCSWYLLLRPNGAEPELLGNRTWPRDEWPALDCYRFPFITPTWLLRRSVFESCGGFDSGLRNLEDWEFAFRLIRAGHRVAVVEQALVIKHSVGDSLYHDARSRLPSLEAIFERHQALWATDARVQAYFLRDIGKLHCMNGDFGKGRRALFRSLRAAPTAQAAVHWLASCAGKRPYDAVRTLALSAKNRHA